MKTTTQLSLPCGEPRPAADFPAKAVDEIRAAIADLMLQVVEEELPGACEIHDGEARDESNR
jgi:hypothetical protein